MCIRDRSKTTSFRRESVQLWGSLASCAVVVYRRSWRVDNPPQLAKLPHIKRNIFIGALVQPAHAGRGAASAGGAGGHFGALRRAVGARGEGREFLLEVRLAARRAKQRVRVGGAADQFLELGSAIGTKVFVDRHGVESPYSNIRLQMRSITPRISAAERPP